MKNQLTSNNRSSGIAAVYGNGLAVLIICVLTAALPLSVRAQVIAPVNYYTFNGASASTDSMGAASLDFNYYQCQYTVNSGGQVGKYLTLGTGSTVIPGGSIPLTNAVTVEFLFKPGYQFHKTSMIRRGDAAFVIDFEYPKMVFTTNHKSGSGANVEDIMTIVLDGIGRKSWGYYVDDRWHHMVFVLNTVTGQKQIWVDGQLPSGFSKTVTTGTFSNTGNTNFYLNQNTPYMKYFGGIDELAVYNTAIPQSLIYKHYLGIQNGQPYSFTNNYSGSYPSTDPVSGPVDPLEYAPGHPNVTMMATEQMVKFPTPRYKPGNTLIKNFNWMDPKFMGGLFQPYVTTNLQAANNGAAIQVELAKNFNYYFHLEFDVSEYATAYVNAANANPDFKLSVITFRGQGPDLKSQNKPASHYLQNSSGQFLDINGNVTTNKVWRPTAPVSSYTGDGTYKYNQFDYLLNRLNRNIDIINENGEIFPHLTEAAMQKDPDVVAAKNASGLDWKGFLGRKFAENENQSYRDIFMAHPRLANAKFTEYAIGGHPTYQPMKWSEAKKVNSQINGQYYSTTDFYTRWPWNWRNWSSAWHGWQWIVESRYHELADGDRLYSPFVCAGWDHIEENNIRPAQWLGLLKALGMTGAEFYYSGFFSITTPWPDSRNWVWQAVMPSYAQAVTSRYEDFLRNGELMNGDVANSYTNPTAPGYSFWAGDHRKLVVVRRHNTVNKFAITGTIQPNSNMEGNTENESVATITLDSQQLKFKVRRQGSTYIYDKSNPSAPVFYQLDGWHEKTHPLHWTGDFNFEAELHDNANAQVAVKTQVPAGTASGDFTNFTSYISWPNNTANPAPVEYQFTPRTNGSSSYSLWIRARSRGGVTTSASIQVNNNTAVSIGCISDTAWTWYRYDACTQQAIRFLNLPLQNNTLRITPGNDKLEIDKILLTTDANLILNSAPPTCSAATATITPNGNTTFCQGGTVTLTASSGTSYLWSPGGQTTQSISVNASGNYSVTVGSGAGCNAVATPVTVTVNSKPNANISVNGSTTLCAGQTVSLSAPAGATSYVWSPTAQTTQSITTGTAGTYSVVVTNSSGCSNTSSPITVTVAQSPTAGITANGPTTFCQGGNVNLTATAGTSYLWTPGGQTTQTINVTNGGNYTVRVTNASGCSATSTATSVTVNSNPSASITASGSTNICSGQDVTLTAIGGGSYLWNTGATSASISANTAGSYTVTVTSANGCSATPAPVQVTVQQAVNAVITPSGPTSFLQGQSVTLTASGGTSYLWYPDGETTQSITVAGSGVYSVTAFNANGCSGSSSPVTVTVTPVNNPPAFISVNGPTAVCEGVSTILTASPGSAYLWQPGGQTTQTITVDEPGTYNVIVTDSTGQFNSIGTVEIDALPVPGSPSIMPSYIPNSAYQLKAYEPSAHSYVWSTGSTNQAINVSAPGNYSARAVNTYGCLSDATVMNVTSVTPQSCATPNMLSVRGITKTEAEVSWNPAIIADSFEITCTEIASGNSTTHTVPGNVHYLGLTGLNEGRDYRWSVKTICVSGTLTSQENIFTTLSGPLPCGSTPQYLSTDHVNATWARVSWFDTQADRFVVRMRPVGTTDFIYLRFRNTETGGTFYGLTPNTSYEWSVRSVCENRPSLYSDPVYFTTPSACPAAGPVAVTTVGFNNATITWNSSVQVDTIMIRYALTGTTSYKYIKLPAALNTGSYTIEGLSPLTTYDAWVATKCVIGSTSMWGQAQVFTTLAEPTVRMNPEAGPLHLNAYPNPTKLDINYVFESDDDLPYTVKVCDMAGRELYQETRVASEGLNNDKVVLAGYANGLYMLVVQKGPMVGRFRFSVSK